MTQKEIKEIFTQHFIELSDEIKKCKDYNKYLQMTELLTQMYDKLQK